MSTSVEYCTLMDGGYVSRWLALHRSMTRHGGAPSFHVCAMDAECEELLNRLALPGVRVTPLRQLEESDPELASVRDERWFRPYRSTAKSCFCRYVFDRNPGVDVVVYLDADLMFFDDPGRLVTELEGHSILLVPQRHPPERSGDDERFGLYQAGTVAFRRGPDSDEALAWWRARCLEWCSFDPEPGRWADQRYLQDWPERFSGVAVTRSPAIGPAPWNSAGHRFERDGDRVLIDGRRLVFYHYSGLNLAAGGTLALRLLSLTPGNNFSGGPVPLGWAQAHRPHAADGVERDLVWRPYLHELSAALATIRELDPDYQRSLASPRRQFVEIALRKRLLWATMWGARLLIARAIDRLERVESRSRALRAASDRARVWIARMAAPVDRARTRWRVE